MRVAVAALGAAFCALTLAAPASAAAPEFLVRTPEDGRPGSEAGELNNPRDMAANSITGHVYVSDAENSRVAEYTSWGFFVKAWGWDVAPQGAPGDTAPDALETCGPPVPDEAPPPGLCQSGSEGPGKGQLSRPNGIAVDAAGAIHVLDRANLRVQKFSPEGQFELMFGGKVNKTKVESGAPAAEQNVCPVDPADICQAGSPGEAPSHLAGTVGNYIAYNSASDAIVIGDKDRIQVFELDGAYREAIPFEGALAAFSGESVNALDVDPSGNVYFSLSGLEDVFKVGPAGTPLAPGKPEESKFDVGVPLAVAVDHDGNVYAIDDPPDILPDTEGRVVKFDAAGNRLIPTKGEEEAERFFPYVPYQGPRLNGIATNICAGSPEPGNLYVAAFKASEVSYLDAYGSGPIGCEPPPPRPPVITTQYATSVGSTSARLQALINPKFLNDTTYYVEYGLAPCSEGGCTSQAPAPAAVLTSQVTNKALKTAIVSLGGLKPGATYHYRFVAQSGGGGPVFGEDADGKEGPEEASFEAGVERTFTTFKTQTTPSACPNDVFRIGPGALLPDCRAYEMVSPLDKEGGDVALWSGKNALVPLYFELNQSAPSGERFAFTSAYPFAGSESAPYVSQYLAERGSGGWKSESISPSRSEIPVQLDNFENDFQGFSADLCQAWLRHNSVAPLVPGAIAGYPNLYRRENCGESPALEPSTTTKPPHRIPNKYRLLMRGASDDGSHSIFVANDKLHPDAPTLPDEFERLLYEHTPEGLRFVCYLPNGAPSPEACAPGTGAASLRNAISADGHRIFWTAFSGSLGGGNEPGAPGQIYLRSGGSETIAISRAVAEDPAWYWTAADDGSKAIFAFDSGPFKDHLYEFDVKTEEAHLIAKGVEGPMGASEDASRIYFVSNEDLDDTGPAAEGAHNLYLYEADPGGGSFTFVMTLADGDVGGTSGAPGPVDVAPDQRAARVTPDGLHVTFSAVAPPPSGYDNRDVQNGVFTQEVYRYDAKEGQLRCVSCNPTGARPMGRELDIDFWAVARIQGWEELQHAPRVISDDGSRVFFESLEALVPRDTNGTWDVYQWEEPGKGSCREEDSSFGEAAGGCVDLISSGEDSAKSTFLDADPSGDSVFIGTQSSLVDIDYGLNDVYVARVGGGFPEPPPQPECEGEACQSPAPAPLPQTPASSTYRGPGNVGKARPRRCKRGARKVRRGGKVRCVKRKRGSRASEARRASR